MKTADQPAELLVTAVFQFSDLRLMLCLLMSMYLMLYLLFQSEKEQKEVQSWSLICDQVLSQPIKKGTVFQLRQNDVSLLCTVHPLPHFNVTEEVIDPASNRFVLRLNSETSV